MSLPTMNASETRSADQSEREYRMSLRIGVLGASRIAELAIVRPAVAYMTGRRADGSA
jgi:hypothetical protein